MGMAESYIKAIHELNELAGELDVELHKEVPYTMLAAMPILRNFNDRIKDLEARLDQIERIM